jgi:hypothetical protein
MEIVLILSSYLMAGGAMVAPRIRCVEQTRPVTGVES